MNSEFPIDVTKSEHDIDFEQIIDSTENKKRSLPNKYSGVLSANLNYDLEHKVFYIDHPYSSEHIIEIQKSIVAISPEDIGQEVLISFDRGNINSPIVTGKIQQVSHKPVNLEIDAPDNNSVKLNVDQNERLVFNAEKEIVLQCGKSSITLTKAGKVLIRGAYLLSRSSGVNKIKGGSVQLN